MGASERLALTSAQYGIWLGQQLDPDSPAYWTAEAVELTGELDADSFETALRQAVAECDALHQRLRSDGETAWQSLERCDDWPLIRRQLDSDAAHAWMQADLQQAPDLARGPLFGSALLHTGPQRTLWYLRVHHVALDGFGYALLAQRVAALYSALVAGTRTPPERAATLAPVVAEDLAYQSSSACAADRAFWCARMEAAPEPGLLAPPAPAAHGVLRRRALLAQDSFVDWLTIASNAGTDWSALLIAAFAAWLQRENGSRDLTIGLPVMGRLGSVALGVPCMAMNIIPLRLRFDPSVTLSELARTVAAELRCVRPHQRYRYEHLKQALGIAGGKQRLFGAVINLMPFDRPLKFGPLSANSLPVSAGPVEDLSLTIAPRAGGIRCDLEANPAAYSDAMVERLHTTLLSAIDKLLAAPERPLAEVLGLRQVADPAIFSGGPLPLPAEPVLAALVRHARATPNRIALEHEGVQLDYAALLRQVQALAGRLRERGVGEESRVALLLPREPRTIVALLAVLWAGGAYVPLDPNGPVLRTSAVLADAAPMLVVTLRAHAALAAGDVLCLDDESEECSPPMNLPSAQGELAYVIYTSGSTGRPNGVMIDRAALAHFVAAASARYDIRAEDRVLQFAPLHFDASVEEIFLPLCAGATLVLRTDAMIESLPRFLNACAEHHISVLDLPTAFWHELAWCVGEGQASVPACIRLVIIGGEAAMAARVAQWHSDAVLLNTYGPTEATVICTTAPLSGARLDDGPLPIGRPLAGVDIAVVDANLRPVSLGEEGELCLIGNTLARGYLGRPELTAQRFIKLDALAGAPRAYRTADRVILGQDLQLRYLGRLDGELKISGQRIDPLEIEAALLQYPGVREAAVVPDADKRLTAFFVAGGTPPPAAALRAFLAERIAAAAVPSFYTPRASLPRNQNGKIDRGALRALDVAPQAEVNAAATPLEHAVMRVWREVLGIDTLTPGDDFFALGGKSLQAIQVANRLSIALQREVSVSALFRHSTVVTLAQSLGVLAGHAPPPNAIGAEFAPLLAIQPGEGPALFCIHPAEGLAWCYLGLARHLPQVPIYGLQARGLSGDAPGDAEAMLDDYLALIRAAQPAGPYRLLGWSSGGGLAHALAVRLRAAGETVSLLAMMDAYPSDIWHGKPEPGERDAVLALLDVIGASAIGDDGQPLERDALLSRFRQPGSTLGAASDEQLARMIDMALHTMRIYRGLRHQRFDGDLLFFHASERGADGPDWQSWAPYVDGLLDKVDIASSHNAMSRPAPLSHIGRVLAQRLAHQGAI
jgi:nonribosomal peptide synthetase MxcG